MMPSAISKAKMIDHERPNRGALVVLGWASDPPSLERLLEQGVPVFYVGATRKIDGLMTDPAMYIYCMVRIPVIVAFEHAKDAYEFGRQIAIAQGVIQ